VRTSHIVDTDQLYQDIHNGSLPAVSFVKPSGWVDGHPASSKWDLFEGFTQKIVDEVKSNPELWSSTAICAFRRNWTAVSRVRNWHWGTQAD